MTENEQNQGKHAAEGNDLFITIPRNDFANQVRYVFRILTDSGVPIGKVIINDISVGSDDRGVEGLFKMALQE